MTHFRFFDLKDIAEREAFLLNPTTPEKVLVAGRGAGLKAGARVIDFGCGFGAALALWGEQFGVGGVGIDVRPSACERARRHLAKRGLDERIAIVCGDAAAHAFEPEAYDVAACIGSTFIWGGFRPALVEMKKAVHEGGRLVVGEVYRRAQNGPPAPLPPNVLPTEGEILESALGCGLLIEDIVRSSEEDWDRYESANWRGLAQWLREHPDHPAHGEVGEHLRAAQAEYFGWAREHIGWAIYVLGPQA